MKKLSDDVVITFDYELFLGVDSGTAEKCIIKPVNYILEEFEKYNGRGIFFVDATYLLTLKKFQHPDFKIISQQIQEIVKRGNNVELHIHPHWLDANPLDNKRWTFVNFDKYRLHSLAKENILSLFLDGKRILEKIIHKVDPFYKISAFRAGGWSIVPFDEGLKLAFLKSGIKYDFSVLPGFRKNQLPMHYYDFTSASQVKPYWRFSNNPNVEDDDGQFVEFPVTTCKLFGVYLLINKLLNSKNKISGDGKGAVAVNLSNKIKKIFLNQMSLLTIDRCSIYLLMKIIHKVGDRKILTIVSHPKEFSESSRRNLKFILEKYNTLTLKAINDVVVPLPENPLH